MNKYEYTVWNGTKHIQEADDYVVDGVSQHGMAITFYKNNKLIKSATWVRLIVLKTTEVTNIMGAVQP